MKKLLIVSPHFPPVHAPDAQRARVALQFLRNNDWEPAVLCVDPDYVAAPQDEEAARTIPSDIRIERCKAWPLALTRLLRMRTLGWRARGAMHRAGCRLINEFQPDLIFFTTTQYPLVTLGPRWQRKFGVPYVVDIQDPWLTDNYSKPGAPPPPGGWKYRIARILASRLEAPTFRAAAGFVSVSPHYLTTLSQRYPWFSSKSQAVIPFGVDTGGLNASTSPDSPAFTPDPSLIQLVSVGVIGPIMSKALEALFIQLKQLKAEQPEIASKIRLYFYGTSYAPPDIARESVRPLAIQHDLADQVTESTDRLTMSAAQASNLAADGLIILTSDDPAYTPSKLAGCFLVNRPVLLIAHHDSRSHQISEELGLAQLLDSDGSTPQAFAEFITDITSSQPTWPRHRHHEVFTQNHTAEARTKQLAAFLHQIPLNADSGNSHVA